MPPPPPAAPGPDVAGAPPSQRVVGIDLARFVAVLGMFVVHVWPAGLGDRYDPRSWCDGTASCLFAVLGGVSLVLASRRLLELGHRRAAVRVLLARGALVVLVGLTLGLVDSPAIVVLVYFGTAIVVAAPFLLLRSRWIALAAGVLALVGGVLNAWWRSGLAQGMETASISWRDLSDPLLVLRGVLSTGVYPVSTWLVYLLVGVLVGRVVAAGAGAGAGAGAQRRRLAGRLAAGGAVAASVAAGAAEVVYRTVGRATLLQGVPGLEALLPPGLTPDDVFRSPGYGSTAWNWPSLLLDSPHTGTVLDICRSTGVALVVVGLALLLAEHLRPATRRLLRPVTAAGAAPLTTYTVHVTLFGLVTAVGAHHQDWAWAQRLSVGAEAMVLHTAVALALGLALTRLGRRGPLEALVSMLSVRCSGPAGRAPDRAATASSAPPVDRVDDAALLR